MCVDDFSLNLFFFRFWCVCVCVFFFFFCTASLTKKICCLDKNICSYGKKSYLRRPDHGYFGYASCTFHLEKGKMPENTNYYLNQCGILYKDNNKIYYSEYFILAQILERETPPQDMQSYVLGEQ